MVDSAVYVPVSKKMLWTGRIISALPVLLLLFSASGKLMRTPEVVEGLGKYGYPAYMLLPIGIAEVCCTILYLIPRTSVLGAILLVGYLGGATATHVRAGEMAFLGPVIAGILVWLGLLIREPRLRPLLPFRS